MVGGKVQTEGCPLWTSGKTGPEKDAGLSRAMEREAPGRALSPCADSRTCTAPTRCPAGG